ncbi:HD-GYP domain-containing protein [Bacillus kwashiorkori]|uniref:HD-GYP domain-containing protein n=1 Tax=Bacillus kwashiorkori TaxID=1522318 RepID=UPI0007826F78|nr:HD domain-containing phosphohydrolase [Bacillus kwashiorkori]
MLVNVNQLQEGVRIKEDIYSLTKNPIVPKGTIVTKEIVSVLRAFLVETVNVEEPLVKGKKLLKSTEKKQKNSKIKHSVFEKKYLHAVQQFKKEFHHWQAGSTVNVNTIRNIIIPLLELTKKTPTRLLFIQQFFSEEDYLYHHSVSLGLISAYFAYKLNMPKADCFQIALAGILCNCGLAKSDLKRVSIFNMSKEQELELKMHPINSYKMLQNIPSLNHGVKVAIFQHHERLDGSGYPTGEKENKIHPYAKIIAIVDEYIQFSYNFKSESKNNIFHVIDQLRHEKFGSLDISLLNKFTEIFLSFTVNLNVLLSNEQIGEIIYLNPMNLTNPFIKVVNTEKILSIPTDGIYIKQLLYELD